VHEAARRKALLRLQGGCLTTGAGAAVTAQAACRRRSKEDHAGEEQRKAHVIGLQNGHRVLLSPPPAPPVFLGRLSACIFLLVLAIVEIDVEVVDAVLHGYVGLPVE